MQYENPQELSGPASTPEEAKEESAPHHSDTGTMQTEQQQGSLSNFDISGFPILEGRLHPMTLVFAIYQSVRRLIIPLIPLIFFGNRMMFVSVLFLLFGGAITRALVRYLTFSYRIEGGELITRQGILERRERHIPLERVQEIRIEQGVLHRVFGVVDATIETAGGKGPEASLSVLSRAEAERLRRAVSERSAERIAVDAEGGAARQSHAEADVVRQLEVRELVMAGLTSNHLLSALALVGTLWAFLDDILPENIYEQIGNAIYGEANRLIERGAQAAILVIALGIVVVFLISLLFSVIGSVVRFYGFTLSRSGEDLQRSYGLLTQRASSLPRRRIQVLEIKEGALRRPFKLASLRADTAGDRSNNQEENKGGRDVLLPIAHSKEVEELLPVIFPDLESNSGSWTRVSKLAIIRGAMKGALVCLVVAAGAYLYQRDLIWLWPLLFLPLIYWINLLRHRNLGYRLGERYFQTRRGRLSRSTHIVPIRNAQTVVIRRSPLDRWLGLATLIVDTAGQTYTGGGPRIGNLPLKEARSLARTLAHRAAVTRYKW